MRYRVGLLSAGFAIALALFGGFERASADQNAAAPQSAVERGKYLVAIQDCNGCHTPFKNGAPDMTRMLQGHPQDIKITAAPKMPPDGLWAGALSSTNTAWAGPWGVSFTTNLTSDRATGIGGWTEQQFIDTIRKGKQFGTGRNLLPPMPWPAYANMTDADLKAMFAYLKTIPAIVNRVPPPIVP